MFGFPSLYIYWAGGPVVLGSGTPQIYNPSGISAPLNSLLNPFTTDLVVNPDEEEEKEDVSCSASPVAIGGGVAVNSKERVRMKLTPPSYWVIILSKYNQSHKQI